MTSIQATNFSINYQVIAHYHLARLLDKEATLTILRP
uniref:Uncharacterized protein n=1 Tax=Arundo donax TaxID=35708 RepID=A0A0A9FQ52_ARUDO